MAIHEYLAIVCNLIFQNSCGITITKKITKSIEDENTPTSISRGWGVIWRDLFVQIELGVDIVSLGIK